MRAGRPRAKSPRSFAAVGIDWAFGCRVHAGHAPQGQIESALSQEKDNNGGDFASAYRRASPILEAVYQMIATVLLGTLGGWWLDERLGASPWLLVAGSVLGVGGGLAVFLRAVLRVSNKKPEKPKSEADGD